VNASCAEWPRLEAAIARRLAAGDDSAPTLASAVLAHLETCPGCRRRALAVDPTLALRPLAEAESAVDADEVEAMRQAVATLRRTRASQPARRGGAAWWRVAAAVALASAALYQLPAQAPGTGVNASVDAALADLASRPLDSGVVPAEFSRQPVFEDLDRPDARVYQLGGGDVSVVMIVDETLDV
jgi:hypothetical protein